MADIFKYAVLDFLDTESHSAANGVTSFHGREWTRSYRWLDESGIALYLAERLQHLGRFADLPGAVQARLEQNLRDSRERAQLLFQEFSRIVHAFSGTGARFVVHKGFALVPEYCPHASLRTQADMDFHVGSESTRLFSDALASLGYRHVRTLEGELTFDTRPDYMPSLADIYKPRSSYRVELHFEGSDLNHINVPPNRTCVETRTLSGLVFPVLNKVETFLNQAAHVAQHFRRGWIRLSNLYELHRFLLSNRKNQEFWWDVRSHCQYERISSNIAYTLALVTCSFGSHGPTEHENLLDGLPPHADLWLKKWGRKYLLAPYPGSKLHLLLGARCPGAQYPSPAGCRPEFRRFVPWQSAVHRIVAAMRAVAENRVPSDELAVICLLMMHHLGTNLGYVIQRIAWQRALRRAQLSI